MEWSAEADSNRCELVRWTWDKEIAQNRLVSIAAFPDTTYLEVVHRTPVCGQKLRMISASVDGGDESGQARGTQEHLALVGSRAVGHHGPGKRVVALSDRLVALSIQIGDWLNRVRKDRLKATRVLAGTFVNGDLVIAAGGKDVLALLARVDKVVEGNAVDVRFVRRGLGLTGNACQAVRKRRMVSFV